MGYQHESHGGIVYFFSLVHPSSRLTGRLPALFIRLLALSLVTLHLTGSE